MQENPLYYRSIVTLDRQIHRAKCYRPGETPFVFSRGSHVIPVVVDEFAAASRHIPIVFLSSGSSLTPVFLVGVKPGLNAFIDAEGQWLAGYIPAYLRRYPFIYGEVKGSDPLVCIDAEATSLGEENGERLFDEDGKETQFLKERINFLAEYHSAGARTTALCALLQELSLVRPITIESRSPDGESAIIHGVLAVDEPKLKSLSDENALKLYRADAFPAIYAHLFSLAAIEKLAPQSAMAA